MDTIKQMTDNGDARSQMSNQTEGTATKRIEKVTASFPSATWLVLGGGSILLSLSLKLMGRDSAATFVGQWAPTMLMLGLYNKIVKVMGSDRQETARSH